jgi:hypothetical protein
MALVGAEWMWIVADSSCAPGIDVPFSETESAAESVNTSPRVSTRAGVRARRDQSTVRYSALLGLRLRALMRMAKGVVDVQDVHAPFWPGPWPAKRSATRRQSPTR